MAESPPGVTELRFVPGAAVRAAAAEPPSRRSALRRCMEVHQRALQRFEREGRLCVSLLPHYCDDGSVVLCVKRLERVLLDDVAALQTSMRSCLVSVQTVGKWRPQRGQRLRDAALEAGAAAHQGGAAGGAACGGGFGAHFAKGHGGVTGGHGYPPWRR